MDFSTIFGLPTHALVVHVAVILVPLAAAGFIATGWRPEWRRAYLLPLALLALAGAAAAVIAASTGESLEGTVRAAARAAGQPRVDFGDHPENGDMARILAVLSAAAICGVWFLEQWGQRFRLERLRGTPSYLVASGVGVAAIVSVIIAGHSGAALVWKDVGNYVTRR